MPPACSVPPGVRRPRRCRNQPQCDRRHLEQLTQLGTGCVIERVQRGLVQLAQRVAHPQGAVVGNADDVARLGADRNLAVLRKEQDRRVDGDRAGQIFVYVRLVRVASLARDLSFQTRNVY